MNRREMLALLAGTAAISSLPDELLAMGRAVHKRAHAATLRTLTAHQNETVATIAELIIPKTDTAGAREAGVPAFIDVMVTEWGDDNQRKAFAAGLANVDERSRAAFGKEFVGCTPAQQSEILEDLDYELAQARDAKTDTSGNFFGMMKWLTLTGYYTSEVGATSEQHFRIVPGRFEPCYPVGQS
jgi:inorganic triphosphatase YgiF